MRSNQPSITSSTPPDAGHYLQPGSYQLDITLPDHTRLQAAAIPEKDTGIFDNMHLQRAGEGTLICRTTASPTKTQRDYQLATPKGGWYSIVLPDNSRMWLNAASSIQFSGGFGHNVRTLLQKGEAYYEVPSAATKGLRIPFQVTIPWSKDTLRITTRGADFNISAYTDDSVIRITLIDGALEVDAAGVTLPLRPGQQFRFTGLVNRSALSKSDSSIIAWKNGQFSLNDKSLPEILRPLSRWYGATIVYRGRLPDTLFNLLAQRRQSVRVVLSMLAVTGQVHFDIEKDTIIVTR